MQLIERLQIMHSKGFLHRDLKPDNILIGSQNLYSENSSVIYLIDFGISKKIKITEEKEPKKSTKFKGNIIFASKNAFSHCKFISFNCF